MNIGISKVRKAYEDAYKIHGDSSISLFMPKGRFKERFDVLTQHFQKSGSTVLDFGCGLAHLKLYLDEFKHELNYLYSGTDITPSFIMENKKKYTEGDFFLIEHFSEIKESYDHIVAAGVFSFLYDDDIEIHREFMFDNIKYLFNKSEISLCLNFMHDEVDYIQADTYHQNVEELLVWVRANLSKRFILDQAVFPYEFNLIVFKDDSIKLPVNLYNI